MPQINIPNRNELGLRRLHYSNEIEQTKLGWYLGHSYPIRYWLVTAIGIAIMAWVQMIPKRALYL